MDDITKLLQSRDQSVEIDNPKTYREYAKIKAQIKELEEKAKQMEMPIISELDGLDGHKLMTDYATFTLMGRKKWKYTNDLTEKEKLMKEKIKFMKHAEEIEGKAELLEDGWMLRCQLAK